MSLQFGQVAHQAGTYLPGFCSMKLQGIFLFSQPMLDGMLVHCIVTPALNPLVAIYTTGRGAAL